MSWVEENRLVIERIEQRMKKIEEDNKKIENSMTYPIIHRTKNGNIWAEAKVKELFKSGSAQIILPQREFGNWWGKRVKITLMSDKPKLTDEQIELRKKLRSLKSAEKQFNYQREYQRRKRAEKRAKK